MTPVSLPATISPSVLAEAASGDATAFARIVRTHHDDMVRVCRVIVGDVDLANDAVQMAWPLAWRRLATLREPSRLRPWLVTIAANEARGLLRRQRRERRAELSVADVGSIDLDPATRDADLDLLSVVRRLAPDDRRILALRFVAGFDATEIGRAVGLTSSGVRSRLARILERLRREVGHD